MNHLIPSYLEQLRNEINYYGKAFSKKINIKTIFFGGGTPSLLAIDQFYELFEELFKNFSIHPEAEISLEANPGTVTPAYLEQLVKIGFNRISFGLQTSNPVQLKLLGRIHDHYDSMNAIKWAKLAGFNNINLDLIYGLPGQSLEDWEKNLEDGLNLGTQHFSLYALGIEENTPLFDWVDKGLVENPDPDLAAEMYELADEVLTNNGFGCYEISNYCQVSENVDWRCQHNLQYWRDKYYLGVGAGAHGYVEGLRYENVNGIGEYINNMRKNKNTHTNLSSAVKQKTEIDRFTAMQETMMLGLRLVEEGISIEKFKNKFDQSPLEVFTNELDYLLKNELIWIDENDNIKLTKKARLVGNIVFQQFVN
jgi:oxygen-independent coproporphyrinogen-3 oxidase